MAIIGGGIMGAGSAYELSRRGVAVTLVEQDTGGVGTQQSGRNWGFIRQQGRSRAELPLMRAANKRWQKLEAELGASFGWTQGGNLALARTAAEARQYLAWVPIGRRHGVDTRLVDTEEVRRIVPELDMPFSAAIYAASDGHADPRMVTAAYAAAARRNGARVLTGQTVRRIERVGDTVVGVRTDTGLLHADTVVCAAGSGARELLRTAGVSLPQSTVRGTVAVTAPVGPVTEATVWAPGLAFRQEAGGRIVVSTGGGGEVDLTIDTLRQTPQFLPAFRKNHRRLRPRVGRELVADAWSRLASRDRAPAEPRPTVSRVHDSIRRLRAALPGLAGQLRIERAWAGLIDSTPDALPVIDRSQTPSGLVVAAGFSGHGFGLAPAAVEAIADLVTGSEPAFDLSAFRTARFTEPGTPAPNAIL
ncbi:NAD(P)/FAD-dependent oxidoreductase [Streptomonospora sediminis]